MKRNWVLLVAGVAAIVGGCKSTPAPRVAAQPIPNAAFDPLLDLRGRHPEIVNAPDFRAWSAENGVSRWHETTVDQDSKRSVVVQSGDGTRLYYAQVAERPAEESQLLVTRAIDTRGTPNARPAVLQLMEQKMGATPKSVHAVRPVVTIDNGNTEVTWEIEVLSGRTLTTYRIRNGAADVLRTVTVKPAQGTGLIPPGVADDLASNELHHLDLFRAEATTWVQGAATIQDKARRILDNVKRTYVYDGTIINISEFTWSDVLVRDSNGRKGICDEWAVVEISYLRAVGIPARMKFLIWTQDGKGVGHACLEYNDGGTWRHMDALWSAFNNPARYRQSGATAVTVMDADYPLDSRSTEPAWGKPDPTGDGMLHPYRDFVIDPAYPGNSRPGYSS